MSDTKYNIIISEGCTAYGTEVNKKLVYGEYDPMTQEEIDELVDYLCEKFKEELRESTVQLNDLIRCFQYDNAEYDSESCDQCGDLVTRIIWNL